MFVYISCQRAHEKKKKTKKTLAHREPLWVSIFYSNDNVMIFKCKCKYKLYCTANCIISSERERRGTVRERESAVRIDVSAKIKTNCMHKEEK